VTAIETLSIRYAPLFPNPQGKEREALLVTNTNKWLYEDIVADLEPYKNEAITTKTATFGRYLGWIVESHLRENQLQPLIITWDDFILNPDAMHILKQTKAGFDLKISKHEPPSIAPWSYLRTRFNQENSEKELARSLRASTLPQVIPSGPYDPFNL
jgi:hypothetical protein